MGETFSQRWLHTSEAPIPELVPTGALSGGAPFRLYYLIAATNASGLLELVDEDGRSFTIGFKRGTPELVRTSDPNLGLVPWLRSRGLLSAADAAKVEEALPGVGGDPVAAILARGLIAPGEIFGHLGGHGEEVLARALLVGSGRFAWSADQPLPPGTFPLGDKWRLLCAVARRLGPELIGQRLGDRIDRPVMRAGDGLVDLATLALTAHEARAVALFDGTRSLAMIAGANPAEAETIYRTGWWLAEMGLASFAAAMLDRPAGVPLPAGMADPHQEPTLVEATPPPRPAGRPINVTPGPRSTAGGRYPTDLEGVRAFLAGLEGRNHFEVLGLPRNATGPLIKQAYFQRARAFHPDTAVGDDALRLAKEAITSRLNEAYAVLGDDVRRADYVSALEAGASSSTVDVANLLVAEQHFQQAAMLAKARRFADALAELNRAISFNDREGEFFAWRAYARFSAALDKRSARAEAFADIDRALLLNERCAVAFLFAARISTVLGDAEGAMKYYRRCLGVDGANVEAQRELRLLEARISK